MLPVTEIPPVVSQPATFFSSLFWKRQRKHFKEYLTGLIVSPKTTISTMNRLFIDGNDQSSLNKFLTQSDWDEKALNDKRLELLQESNKTKWKPWGVVALDDTLCHKTGKNIECTGKFWDHVENRYVIGHNLITSHYTDKEISYPIDYRLYHRDGSDAAEKFGFKTKIQLAVDLIHDAMSRDVPVYAFVFDSWFLCKEIHDVIESYGKAYVSQAKSNRIMWLGETRTNVKDYAESVPGKEFREVEVKGKVFLAHRVVCKMSKLGKVGLCVTYEKGSPEDKMFLVTNKPSWEEKKILETYGKRWTIDAFYRDAKQVLGFEDYQVRRLKGIKRHWYLVFLAYSLLKLGIAKGDLGRWLNAETIGRACRNVVVESIQSFLIWVYGKFRENVSLDVVMDMVSIKIAKV